MMREMSNRDKMLLVIITAIIILVAGFLALVRPKYDALVADKATYEDTQIEWQGIEDKIAQIEPLENKIKEDVSDAQKTAELFVNEAFGPSEDTFDNQNSDFIFDQYLQPVLDECELEVSNYTLEGITSEQLSYYCYTPDVLTYSLLESADINGTYATQVTELLKESNYLSEREMAEVLTNKLEMQVRGDREHLMAFLDKIKEDENAILVTNAEIVDYQFGEGLVEVQTVKSTDAEGNEVTSTQEVKGGDGKSELNLTLKFFNAVPIETPKFN